jgi:hypothetical protein
MAAEFFLAHFKIKAAGSKWAALAPAVAIIVYTGYVFRIIIIIF